MEEKKKKQKEEAATVEFGMEFGDMNASKFYETAAANKQAVKNQQENQK
ncbi:MAG: hypothetical protein ABF649_17220 [Bacillus sp. (in: firmicutes)]